MVDNDRDRRIHPRHSMTLNVTVMMVGPEQGYFTSSRDVSLGGLFINTPIRLSIGDFVDLEIEPKNEGDASLEARGEVVRVVQGVGVGLRFVDPSAAVTARIQEMINAER